MHIQTHLVLSWLTGCQLQQHRDRILIAWAGVVPDLDGLTLLAGIEAYERWHHTLTHGLSAALGACGYTAVRFGRSFLEASLPARVDAAAVETLRRRFTPTLRARG